jgi:hypothetical protein
VGVRTLPSAASSARPTSNQNACASAFFSKGGQWRSRPESDVVARVSGRVTRRQTRAGCHRGLRFVATGEGGLARTGAVLAKGGINERHVARARVVAGVGWKVVPAPTDASSSASSAQHGYTGRPNRFDGRPHGRCRHPDPTAGNTGRDGDHGFRGCLHCSATRYTAGDNHHQWQRPTTEEPSAPVLRAGRPRRGDHPDHHRRSNQQQ